MSKGFVMRPDQPELMALNNGGSNLFEILIRELYTTCCRPGDICVDAGANQGHHTLGMVAVVGRDGIDGIVHSFEPIPVLAQRLRDMATAKSLQVSVYQLALADVPGRAKFNYIKNWTGLSGFYDREYNTTTDVEVLDVEVVTLDGTLCNLDKWRFYKLDLECAEFRALKGSRNLIMKCHPLIVFENGFDKTAAIAGYTKEEWFDFFDEIDYDTYDLYGYKITPDRWPDFCQPFNTIAIARNGIDGQFVSTIWRDKAERVIAAVKNGTLTYP